MLDAERHVARRAGPAEFPGHGQRAIWSRRCARRRTGCAASPWWRRRSSPMRTRCARPERVRRHPPESAWPARSGVRAARLATPPVAASRRWAGRWRCRPRRAGCPVILPRLLERWAACGRRPFRPAGSGARASMTPASAICSTPAETRTVWVKLSGAYRMGGAATHRRAPPHLCCSARPSGRTGWSGAATGRTRSSSSRRRRGRAIAAMHGTGPASRLDRPASTRPRHLLGDRRRQRCSACTRRTSRTTGGDTVSQHTDQERRSRRGHPQITWRLMPVPDARLLHRICGPGELRFRRAADEPDIGLSSAAFGLGARLFYITYVICEVPSNLAMEKVGARIWIARIMISWGLVSGAMALVVGPISFYAVRLLLGAAEAGFFPGVILYLTYWFPRRVPGPHRRDLHGGDPGLQPDRLADLGGAAADRWLDGPARLAMDVHPRGHPRRPARHRGAVRAARTARRRRGSTPEQRAWLTAARRRAGRAGQKRSTCPLAGHDQQIRARRSLVYAGSVRGQPGLSLWQPQIIKSFGLTNMQVGLLNGVPFALASVAMILWGRRSDRGASASGTPRLPLGFAGARLGLRSRPDAVPTSSSSCA